MRQANLDVTDYTNLSILFTGKPGVGKTHMIATIADAGNHCLLIDFDQDGHETLKHVEFYERIQNNIVVVVFEQFSDLDKIYKACRVNTVEAYAKVGIKTDRPFDAVILDTISEMQSFFINEIRPNTSNMTDAFRSMDKLNPLQIQHWGKVIDLTRLVCKEFKRLPMMFIATAHEELVKDEMAGTVTGAVQLNGKVKFDVGKYFSIMARMSVNQKGKYVLSTVATGKWSSKSRVPAPKIIEDPTFAKLVAQCKPAANADNEPSKEAAKAVPNKPKTFLNQGGSNK